MNTLAIIPEIFHKFLYTQNLKFKFKKFQKYQNKSQFRKLTFQNAQKEG